MKQSNPSATRTDVKTLEKVLRKEMLSLEEKIEDLDEKFTNKFDQILTKLDPVVTEIENARLDRELGTNQTSVLRKAVESHEKRIAQLETTAA